MQYLVMAMVIGIFVHDASLNASGEDGVPSVMQSVSQHPWLWVPALLGAKLIVVGLYGLLCRLVHQRVLHTPHEASGSLKRINRANDLLRFVLVLLFYTDLAMGGLVWLRGERFDWVLLDELLFLLPTLLAVIACWWLYYPIDRTMRQASFMRHLQEGRSVAGVWTRGQYILVQTRHQLALVTIPLLLIMAWHESVGFVDMGRLLEGWFGEGMVQHESVVREAVTLAGALGVYLFAPVIIRRVWDTAPLPHGELRERLTRMCKRYRVGVREMLLWRTFGGVSNAAVLGVVGPMRYILLTDALLENMPARNVEAVMAHEVAHVKRRHMPWFIIIAIGMLTTLQLLWTIGLSIAVRFAQQSSSLPSSMRQLIEGAQGIGMDLAVLLGTLITWALAFFWVTRRFERQADTFAVQHFQQTAAEDGAANTANATGPGDMDYVEAPPIDPPTAPPEPAIVTMSTEELARKLQTGEAAAARYAHDPHRIGAPAIDAMTGALQHIADLYGKQADWRSLWHGSIAWRQDYLRGLLGQPINALPIDRQVRWIKAVGLGMLVGSFTAAWWLGML